MIISYTENISWVLLDDIIFVFDEIENTMFVLEDIAKDFWLMIQNKVTFSEIITMLSEIYDADVKIIDNDIKSFIDMLTANKLIFVRD